MSISAMKQALKALETDPCKENAINNAQFFIKQAIAEAEKQEPVAIGGEWKPCVKLPIVVHVREQRKGETHVSTREGITPVKEDDLIMRGVAGEEYPIGRELFNRTYTFDTAPVHDSDISQERVDETAKCGHEFECPRCGHCCQQREWVEQPDLARVGEVGVWGDKREWAGLTDEEIKDIREDFTYNDEEFNEFGFAKDIEAKLKEKNT